MKTTKINVELVEETSPFLTGNSFNYSSVAQERTNKVPIKRGCPNQTCFCTGVCQEIIGYRDKVQGEF